jgi:hypothetical protein
MTVRTKEPIAGANSPLTTSNSLGVRQNALIGSRNRNGPRTWIARGRGRFGDGPILTPVPPPPGLPSGRAACVPAARARHGRKAGHARGAPGPAFAYCRRRQTVTNFEISFPLHFQSFQAPRIGILRAPMLPSNRRYADITRIPRPFRHPRLPAHRPARRPFPHRGRPILPQSHLRRRAADRRDCVTKSPTIPATQSRKGTYPRTSNILDFRILRHNSPNPGPPLRRPRLCYLPDPRRHPHSARPHRKLRHTRELDALSAYRRHHHQPDRHRDRHQPERSHPGGAWRFRLPTALLGSQTPDSRRQSRLSPGFGTLSYPPPHRPLPPEARPIMLVTVKL